MIAEISSGDGVTQITIIIEVWNDLTLVTVKLLIEETHLTGQIEESYSVEDLVDILSC